MLDKLIKSIAPLAALGLAAAGCSALPFGDRTEAYELVTAETDSTWCASGDEWWFFDLGADLVGPHFSVSLLCHYEGTEVPEPVAERSPDLADLPEAADGTELLINQFALEPNLPLEFEEGEVAAWIAIGEERIDLDALPAPGSLLAVAAPTDEDAVLWVEDDGRAQGLSLRSGDQVEPIMAYYNGLSTDVVQGDSFSAEATVLNGDKAWDLTCHSDFLEGDRSVWREDLGWAAEESVFLQVTFNWCTYEDNLVWHLDPEASLAAQPGAEPVAPLSMSAEALPDTGGTLRYTAVFSIPENSRTLLMILTPVGDLENIVEGDDYAFLDTPAPSERDLYFI